jgi:serine/threonine protein kinase/tetratricopeptide (TPR) repeat protein
MMAEQIDDNQERSIRDAMQQFIDAQIEGHEPDIDEIANKYPEFKHQIRKRISNIRKINSLFANLTKTDESDFADIPTGYDLIGQKVGSFEIVEMIGRGGMGVVYLARDTKLKRSVAIKSVPAPLANDSTAQVRFKREAELLASLNHPNIAVIHDIIEEDKSGYLILEYVPGETLAERIAREPVKLQEALSISQQIAEAISAAHEKGVVHRDLKPGNIKIMPDGRVKVLDFGLAKASTIEGKPAETTVTQPGHVVGTPAFMSPEQARGKDTDHRTDIWSFGCIMYQILTGQVPFEGKTATDTLVCILERQPDWEMLPESTPMNIRVLIRRCLEKDPHRRLQHIGDVAIEIRETLNLPAAVPPVTSPSSTSLEQQIATKPQWRSMMLTIVAVIMVLLCCLVLWVQFNQQPGSSPREIRLVVLPFENLGPLEDDTFVAGMTGAITARLAGVQDLVVISRNSALQYTGKETNIQKIGEDLGVDYILEGTVQRELSNDPKSPLRIIPVLVRVSDNKLLWAETYDSNMTEVFSIQSNLAERVAQSLDITLLEPERRALRSSPTENTKAYEYYMRGDEYIFYRGYTENNIRIAIQMYEKVIELDPAFAAAYAQLSKAHSYMYWHHHDRSKERLDMAKRAADKAFQLTPRLPEAHVAMGYYYYYGHLDYDRALEQFTIARKSLPNDSVLLTGMGFVQRRQGKFREAAETLEKALEFDPLNTTTVANLGETFIMLSHYEKADRILDLAISQSPDWHLPYSWKAILYLLAEGRIDKARAVLEKGLEHISLSEMSFLITLITIDVYDGKYQEALDKLSKLSENTDDQYFFVPNALRSAQIYGYMNEKELAIKYYDDARKILEARIKKRPEDERFHSSLGIAYAGLGRKEDALREGRLAVEILPVSKDAMRGLSRVEDLARIYVMAGEHDAAIDQLAFLLDKPSKISIHLLKLDPTWAPLRNHPRFKKIIEQDK